MVLADPSTKLAHHQGFVLFLLMPKHFHLNFNLHFQFHVTPLIYELRWLLIRYRIKFKILLITFKILNFLVPTYLSSLFSLRLPSKYNLRNSSDKLLLSYPRFKPKATLCDHSFTCAAPKLWNALPFDISASTVSIYEAKLKTHLFRHAFLS